VSVKAPSFTGWCLALHKQGACRISGGAHKHLPLTYAPRRCFRGHRISAKAVPGLISTSSRTCLQADQIYGNLTAFRSQSCLKKRLLQLYSLTDPKGDMITLYKKCGREVIVANYNSILLLEIYFICLLIGREHYRKEIRITFSGMWCRVGLVKTDVSEESIASIIRVERVSELGTTLAVTRRFSSPKLRWRYVLRNVGSYMSHTASYPRKRSRLALKGHIKTYVSVRDMEL
jgi:hypothetical protein